MQAFFKSLTLEPPFYVTPADIFVSDALSRLDSLNVVDPWPGLHGSDSLRRKQLFRSAVLALGFSRLHLNIGSKLSAAREKSMNEADGLRTLSLAKPASEYMPAVSNAITLFGLLVDLGIKRFCQLRRTVEYFQIVTGGLESAIFLCEWIELVIESSKTDMSSIQRPLMTIESF
jgi:hypothetical protein